MQVTRPSCACLMLEVKEPVEGLKVLMVPLSLSYDHRIIDGAAAARFLRRMADLLEQPMHMLLHA